MKKDFSLNEQDFENLLSWLSNDREAAGEQYEQIRAGLIRFFRFRGCQDPAFLADETINRVAVRISTFDYDAKAKIINVFYGFASKIFLENVSRYKKKELQLEPNLQIEDTKPLHEDDSEKITYECLESCLGKLGPDENKLVITYYSKERSASITVRKDLAESMNMKVGTLHTRVCRIRSVLRQCIEECIRENRL
jgi:DNA-directed RNA polymerase specialized sigma24 family protein